MINFYSYSCFIKASRISFCREKISDFYIKNKEQIINYILNRKEQTINFILKLK